MVIFCVVDGLIGVGKTTLLKALDKKHKNDKSIEIWFEPDQLFNNYRGIYRPLELFYENGGQDSGFIQLHIINKLREFYFYKIKKMTCHTKIVITERSAYSPLIFTESLNEMRLITDFQAQLLTDQTREMLAILPHLVNKIFHMNAPHETLLSRIQQRSAHSENRFLSMDDYLKALSSNYNAYMLKFQLNSSLLSYKRTSTLEIDVLVKELEDFLQITA